MRHPRRLSEREREQRRDRDRQRLHQATEQLLESEGWQRRVCVRARNGLARYSVNNQLIIALSKPGASYVCGFRASLQLGYQVRKGEKAIWILAPITVKDRDAAAEEDGEKPRVFFRAVPVFDRTQVDAIEGADPAPLDPSCQPLTGGSHRHLLEPLQAFAASLGYSVSFSPIQESTGGWCDPRRQAVAVDASQPVNTQRRNLVHELAHAIGVGYREYRRHQAEVIVDTVIFSICPGQTAELVWS